MPSKTLISLGVTAAIALGAIAHTMGGKGVQGDGEPAMQAPVYSDKLVKATLGPKTFAFPMNLYNKQVGPDAQGGVWFALRWPALEAFPAGASVDPAYRDAYMDEEIGFAMRYVSKVPIESLPLRYIEAPETDPGHPLAHLANRIKGAPVYGLTPFYADLTKVTAYLQSLGVPTSRERVLEVGEDWYLVYGSNGSVVTIIECDNHEMKGAGLIAGAIERTPPGEPRGMCRHYFTVPSDKLVVRVDYLRAYMQDWRRIEDRVRDLIRQGEQDGQRMQAG